MSLKRRAKDSWSILIKNWRFHPALFLIDLAFLVLFFGSFFSLQIIIIDDVERMTTLVMDELGRVTSDPFQSSAVTPDLFNQVMTANPEISQIFSKIILTFFLMLFVIFLVWNLLQGINWALSHHIISKLKHPVRYVFRFFSINLFWFGILLVLFYIWFNLSFYNMKSIVPVVNQTLLNWSMGIVLAMVAYFMAISYVLASKRTSWKSIMHSFKKGSERVAELLLIFVISVGMVVVSLGVVYMLMGVHIIAAFIGLLVVVLPVLSYLRVFNAVSVGEIVK